MTSVVQTLWFARDMPAAVQFYIATIPGSTMGPVVELPGNDPPGAVVEFTLGGQSYRGMQAGQPEPFNQAFSITVECDDQAEIDRLWNALGDGGTTQHCGWLRDRWGLSWQVVPAMLGPVLRGPDRARAARVFQAMLGMAKFDIAALHRAADGH
ncbi:MAG: VOC family protein [Gemmatimonadaceae bacterium]|nr:VOC family protein [Acetobacteraceae bacterium]